MSEDIILSIFSVSPEKCSNLCKMEHSCVFWRAQWDGALCYLLSHDYQSVSNATVMTDFKNHIKPDLWILCWPDQLDRLRRRLRLLLLLYWGWLRLYGREAWWVREIYMIRVLFKWPPTLSTKKKKNLQPTRSLLKLRFFGPVPLVVCRSIFCAGKGGLQFRKSNIFKMRPPK